MSRAPFVVGCYKTGGGGCSGGGGGGGGNGIGGDCGMLWWLWLSMLSGGGSIIFTNMLNKHYYNGYAWWVRVFGGSVISYLYPYL